MIRKVTSHSLLITALYDLSEIMERNRVPAEQVSNKITSTEDFALLFGIHGTTCVI